MKTSAKIGIKNHPSIAVNTVLAGCEMEWQNIGCGRLKPALLNLFLHFFSLLLRLRRAGRAAAPVIVDGDRLSVATAEWRRFFDNSIKFLPCNRRGFAWLCVLLRRLTSFCAVFFAVFRGCENASVGPAGGNEVGEKQGGEGEAGIARRRVFRVGIAHRIAICVAVGSARPTGNREWRRRRTWVVRAARDGRLWG